jgi:AAHS family 4-hydroxybenzoate transporter-like MFS transporter
MESPSAINVSEIIDNSQVGKFQLGIFILCGLCLIMDGFDVQAIGYVAPALSQEWKISGAVLGSVLSAALVGVLFGSIFLSMVADKIGRRPVLIAAALSFSVLTLLTPLVNSVGQLLLIRFLAGIPLGSIMPNAMSLVGEYSPRRIRIPVMVVVGTGFTAGAAIGGVIAFWIIPNFGWRSIFLVGGAIPLLVGICMFFLLPESLQFLTLHDKNPQALRKWLARVDPHAPVGANVRFVVPERKQLGVPLVKLFQQGRAMRTILLWAIYFMNLLNLYFLSSWLPTVATPMVKAAGAPPSVALLLGTTLQLAGVVGAVLLGWFAQRFGFTVVLTLSFLLACANIAAIGRPGISLSILFLVVFFAGLGIVGSQSVVNALAATLYPTDLRSTGIGSGLGVGRIGSIVGPQVAGILIGLHWQAHQLFLTAAVPALIAACLVLVLHATVKPQASSSAQSPVLVH